MTDSCYHLRKIGDIFCKASCFDNCTISSYYNKLCKPLLISEMMYCNEEQFLNPYVEDCILLFKKYVSGIRDRH